MSKKRFIKLDCGEFDKTNETLVLNDETLAFLKDVRGMSDHNLYFNKALSTMFNSSMVAYVPLAKTLGILTDKESSWSLKLNEIQKVVTDDVFAALSSYQSLAQEKKRFGTAGDITELIIEIFNEIEEKILIPKRYESSKEREMALKKQRANSILSRMERSFMDPEMEQQVDWAWKKWLYFDQNAYDDTLQKLRRTFGVHRLPDIYQELNLTLHTGETVIDIWRVFGALQRIAEVPIYANNQIRVGSRPKKEQKTTSWRFEWKYKNQKYYPTDEKMAYFNQLHKMDLEGIADNSYLKKMFPWKASLKAKNLAAFGSLTDSRKRNYLEDEHIDFLKSRQFMTELKKYLKLPNLWVQKIIAEKLLEMIEGDLKRILRLNEKKGLTEQYKTTMEAEKNRVRREKIAKILVRKLQNAEGVWWVYGIRRADWPFVEPMLKAICMIEYDWKSWDIDDILQLFWLEKEKNQIPRDQLSKKIINIADNKKAAILRNMKRVMSRPEFLAIFRQKPQKVAVGNQVRWQYIKTFKGIDYFLIGTKKQREIIVTTKSPKKDEAIREWEVVGLEITKIIPWKKRSPQANHWKIVQKPDIFNQ